MDSGEGSESVNLEPLVAARLGQLDTLSRVIFRLLESAFPGEDFSESSASGGLVVWLLVTPRDLYRFVEGANRIVPQCGEAEIVAQVVICEGEKILVAALPQIRYRPVVVFHGLGAFGRNVLVVGDAEVEQNHSNEVAVGCSLGQVERFQINLFAS